jgi:hypothetical protein
MGDESPPFPFKQTGMNHRYSVTTVVVEPPTGAVRTAVVSVVVVCEVVTGVSSTVSQAVKPIAAADAQTRSRIFFI